MAGKQSVKVDCRVPVTNVVLFIMQRILLFLYIIIIWISEGGALERHNRRHFIDRVSGRKRKKA